MKYILIIIAFIAALFVWEIYFPKNAQSDETRLFWVEKGEGAMQVGSNLRKEGIIKSKFAFDIYAFFSGKSKDLKAGKYELSPSMSIIQITDKIVLGDISRKVITIIEGWTVEDIKEYLKGEGVSGTENIGKDQEGYLFPDTYEIYPADNADNVIKQMRSNFDSKIAELKNDILIQKKTVPEIIAMASILEKEVKTYDDKQVVAGLLWKRIQAGMPLQVDAARETYSQKGLPSAPICNPGLESIKAATYPVKTGYWFYLSTRDGRTIFSKTLAEHNRAIEKYLK